MATCSACGKETPELENFDLYTVLQKDTSNMEFKGGGVRTTTTSTYSGFHKHPNMICKSCSRRNAMIDKLIIILPFVLGVLLSVYVMLAVDKRLPSSGIEWMGSIWIYICVVPLFLILPIYLVLSQFKPKKKLMARAARSHEKLVGERRGTVTAYTKLDAMAKFKVKLD